MVWEFPRPIRLPETTGDVMGGRLLSRLLIVLLLCGVCIQVRAQSVDSEPAWQLESAAALWRQREPAERAPFLAGLCEGLGTSAELQHLADLTCREEFRPGDPMRFCAVVATKPREAIEFLDAFYKNPAYSDVPNWAAVGTYNDRSCKENRVGAQVPRLQARVKCQRVLANMHGATKAAREAQAAECRRLAAQ